MNWNGLEHLKAYLPSILATGYPGMRTCVIDNGSTDGSLDWLRENHQDVEVIQTGANYGYAGGYSRGLAKLDAEFFLLINSDIKVEPGWLHPMMELMDSNPAIAAVQPKILSLKEPEDFEYAGAAGGFVDFLAYPFCRGRIFSMVEKDRNLYDDSRPIFWASGACFMVRSKCYNEAGGLDEDFFAHMEEIDLCWRLQNLGYEIWYCGKSSVQHLGGGSLTYGNPRKTFLNFRNSLIANVKNMSRQELLWKLPFRLALDIVAAWKVLLEGKSGDFRAILRAHWQFYTKIGKWFSKRKNVKGQKNLRQLKGVYLKSIVLKSFLGGIQRFRELNPSDFSGSKGGSSE